MHALSIRQPWAWLIVNGYKDVENRVWKTHVRGRVLIHASASCSLSEYKLVQEFVRRIRPDITVPPFGYFSRGGIVGEAEIVDCVSESNSPWFFGPYAFVLRNAKPLPFKPYRGALKFFNVEY